MPVCRIKNSTLTFDAVEEYFAHLNPLAERIAADISTTRSTYGQLWQTLNHDEQTNIINETLIKPEISLKYFDYFSASSTSLSSVSSSPTTLYANVSSADMIQKLTRCVNGNISNVGGVNLHNDLAFRNPQFLCNSLSQRFSASPVQQQPQLSSCRGLKPPSSPPPPPPVMTPKPVVDSTNITSSIGHAPTITKARSKYKDNSNDIQDSYDYDGSNLRTYAIQKVARKIIYDDILGSYRDEHSRPFSYRTKSQINLQQQQFNVSLTGDEKLSKTSTISDRLAQSNYEKLKKELKRNWSGQLEKINIDQSGVIFTSCEAKYNPMDVTSTDVPVLLNQRGYNNNSKIEQPLTQEIKTNPSSTEKQERQRNMIETFRPMKTNPQFNCTVYSDVYCEHGENSTLMHQYSSNSGSGLLTISSSSTATSDDDNHSYCYYDDDDEKTLCEGVKLLDNDTSLRKGFDFLNNW